MVVKMKLYEVAHLSHFFVICTAVHMVIGRCTPSSCTQECYPKLWERDLCTFYREVSSWRDAAERCGLILPDSPDRSPQLPPQAQWNLARAYWDQLQAVWQQAAAASGALSGTTPKDSASGSPPGSTEPTGSGDNMLSPTITSEPPTSPADTTTQYSRLPEWLESTRSWSSDFTQWESFARSQSGLKLPDSTSNNIVGRLNNGTAAAAVRANSAEWISLLNDWRQGYDTYAGTFSGLCPNS